MDYSTKNTPLGRIADYLGINKKFHKYREDDVDPDSGAVVSPVEATLVEFGEIKDKGKILSKSGKEIELGPVLGESAELFSNGVYFNFYLNPAKNSHYWRIPYDCELISIKINPGKALFPALIWLDNLFEGNNYFAKAIRKNASVGLVFKTKFFPFAMIPVGSLNVSGIHVVNASGGKYRKGDIGGYFSIGSSVLLCFPDYPLEVLIKTGTEVNIGEAIIKFKERL
jgi:phosphatidylserine decarboxylase precursor